MNTDNLIFAIANLPTDQLLLLCEKIGYGENDQLKHLKNVDNTFATNLAINVIVGCCKRQIAVEIVEIIVTDTKDRLSTEEGLVNYLVDEIIDVL